MSWVKWFLLATLLIWPAQAQTPGTFVSGQVLNAADLNVAFAKKTDYPSAALSPGGANGAVQYNNSGVFGGYTDAQLTTHCLQFTNSLSGCVPATGGAGATAFLNALGQWTVPAGGGGGGGGGNLAVNTTTITGGTINGILYDSGPGLLQEYTPTTFLSTFIGTKPNNQFLVGPCTGGPLAPTWRTFCSQDLDQVLGTTNGSLALRGAATWGGLNPVANNNLLVDKGPGAVPVYTSPTTWFDNAYCSTVGYILVRTTGAWTCSSTIPTNVQWYGARGDGTCTPTCDDAAITAAYNAVKARGGTVYFPATTNCYTISASIAILDNNVWLRGDGSGSKICAVHTFANNYIKVGSASVLVSDAGIENLQFTTSDAAQSTVSTGIYVSNAYNFKIRNIRSVLMAYSLDIENDSTNCASPGCTYDVYVLNFFATSCNQYCIAVGRTGTAALQSTQVYLDKIDVSQSQSATSGGCLETNNVGGIYLTDVSSLYCWTGWLVAPTTNQNVSFIFAKSVTLDSSLSVGLTMSPTGGNVYGASFVDTLLSSAGVPGCTAAAGAGGYGLEMAYSSGGINGVAFTNLQAINNCQHGVVLLNGTNIRFVNSRFGSNSQKTASTYGGLYLGGVTHVSVIGGDAGTLGAPAIPSQQEYGIFVSAGDYINITGVDVTGNTIGGITYGSTGAHNRITNNPGYNPVGTGTITVGASTWTYTAGPTPETHYISGGAGISFGINGQPMPYNSTLTTVHLSPGELYQIAYTTAPTVLRQVH